MFQNEYFNKNGINHQAQLRFIATSIRDMIIKKFTLNNSRLLKFVDNGLLSHCKISRNLHTHIFFVLVKHLAVI